HRTSLQLCGRDRWSREISRFLSDSLFPHLKPLLHRFLRTFRRLVSLISRNANLQSFRETANLPSAPPVLSAPGFPGHTGFSLHSCRGSATGDRRIHSAKAAVTVSAICRCALKSIPSKPA